MIYYLLDFVINNNCLFKSTTILINIDNYTKRDLFFILFFDVFINKIPFIFFIIVAIKYINKLLKKYLSSSLLVDNFIFIIDYFVFMLIIFLFQIKEMGLNNLIFFMFNNFFYNYLLFWILKTDINKATVLTKYRKKSKI